MVSAIETKYNGFRFRSRAEARWAVFFDTLNIQYEYEKEGFHLDGDKYLPDFWLPGLKCWIEVKGVQYSEEKQFIGMDGPNDWRKCEKLAQEYKSDVFMVFAELRPLSWSDEGVFGSNRAWKYKSATNSTHFIDGCCTWGECPLCGSIGFGHFGQHCQCDCECTDGQIRTLRKRLWRETFVKQSWCFQCGKHLYDSHSYCTDKAYFPHIASKDWRSPRLKEAYAAARAARFEHGGRR